MRHVTALITAIVLAALALSGVRAQDEKSGDWQPMEFHNLQTPSKTDLLQTIIWPDVIAQANDYVQTKLGQKLNGKNALITALATTYRRNDKTIIISAIATRGCDNGANSKGAEMAASMCPLRIVVLQNGKQIASKTDTGCYVDHEDNDLPPKNRTDNSYTRFDPQAGMIAFKTIVGGEAVPRCAKSYSIN